VCEGVRLIDGDDALFADLSMDSAIRSPTLGVAAEMEGLAAIASLVSTSLALARESVVTAADGIIDATLQGDGRLTPAAPLRSFLDQRLGENGGRCGSSRTRSSVFLATSLTSLLFGSDLSSTGRRARSPGDRGRRSLRD